MKRAADPASGIASHLDRGRQLRLDGCFAEALECFETALRMDPGCARAHAGYGATLVKMQQNVRAMDSYWRCLQLQPIHPRVYAALGSLYLTEGRAEPAVDCFRASLAQAGNDPVVRSNLLFALNCDI